MEDKKRKLTELLELEIFTETDVVQCVRSDNNKLWMTLISLDWFFYFFQYLDLKDVASLDSAFCNHEDRMHLLILLRRHTVPCLFIERNRFIN